MVFVVGFGVLSLAVAPSASCLVNSVFFYSRIALNKFSCATEKLFSFGGEPFSTSCCQCFALFLLCTNVLRCIIMFITIGRSKDNKNTFYKYYNGD